MSLYVCHPKKALPVRRRLSTTCASFAMATTTLPGQFGKHSSSGNIAVQRKGYALVPLMKLLLACKKAKQSLHARSLKAYCSLVLRSKTTSYAFKIFDLVALTSKTAKAALAVQCCAGFAGDAYCKKLLTQPRLRSSAQPQRIEKN